MENFKSSGIVTKQAHVRIPKGLYEEEHGRQGFFGRVAHLYHVHPPVGWTHIEGELRPRCLPPLFDETHLKKNNMMPLLSNDDLRLSAGILSDHFKNFFRNADSDELFFVHRGRGRFETVYGYLDFTEGDYVCLPRGTTYKIFIHATASILKIESSSEFREPDRGLLGPNALYDQTAITVPEAAMGSEQNLEQYTVDIMRSGKITSVTYPFNPLDAKGWKGSLYPYKLSIYDFCPVMSHRYHVPPSAHTTFVAHNFVVCSFVARPLEDSKEEVLKVPFYHANIDFDEVLFYHRGNFFSRDNIEAGGVTLHPQGIHHGPHPKAYKRAQDKTHTDEYAVMVDARRPLQPSTYFCEREVQDYWKSWK